MIHVYVLRSLENGKRYVGITANIRTRLRTHARGTTKGGQQLGKFKLIHREPFPNYAEARRREKYLKSGSGRQWLDTQFGRAIQETAIDTAALQLSVTDDIGV